MITEADFVNHGLQTLSGPNNHRVRTNHTKGGQGYER
jgi:hypothetical protein